MSNGNKKLIIKPENLTPDMLFDSLVLEWLINEVNNTPQSNGIFLAKGITKQALVEKMLSSQQIINPS